MRSHRLASFFSPLSLRTTRFPVFDIQRKGEIISPLSLQRRRWLQLWRRLGLRRLQEF